jgi:hypothetical protein
VAQQEQAAIRAALQDARPAPVGTTPCKVPVTAAV